MDVRLVPEGREVYIHPWFHMRMNHSHVYCRLEESFLKKIPLFHSHTLWGLLKLFIFLLQEQLCRCGFTACSSKYWFSNVDMMFCHGRGKKKILDHLSEYSYQVKASSWGDNSHYLIIPEIMQVRSWKGLDFLGVYKICWMPTVLRRIPESGFQVTKWLKNLIFENQMKINPK